MIIVTQKPTANDTHHPATIWVFANKQDLNWQAYLMARLLPHGGKAVASALWHDRIGNDKLVEIWQLASYADDKDGAQFSIQQATKQEARDLILSNPKNTQIAARGFGTNEEIADVILDLDPDNRLAQVAREDA